MSSILNNNKKKTRLSVFNSGVGLQIIGVIISICIFGGAVYGSYWVVKTMSYKIFYEDMVQETVKEMIKEKQYLHPEYR